MFVLLMEFLRTKFGLFSPFLMNYSTRMILAAITSWVICIFAGPYFIKKLYELKIGQSIRLEECPLLGKLHQKKQNTPTMGGILILFSMIISLFLWMDPSHVFTLILLVSTLLLGILGGTDDYLKLRYRNTKGLSARYKLLGQVLFSALLAIYFFSPNAASHLQIGEWFSPPIIKESNINYLTDGQTKIEQVVLPLYEYAGRIYIPFFKDPVFVFSGSLAILGAIFIIFVITGSSNAVNLTDGLDGLAAGCLILVASSLALIAFVSNHIDLATYLTVLYIEGSGEIAIYLSAFVGACLGFLWYNGHPAQLFMGDTGSLALGGILGVSAVLLRKEMLLGLVGGIFVAEALSVILQVGSYKLRNKKRIFLCAPLHHHFEYKGWAETKVVIRFWIIGLLLALIGIASLKIVI